MHLLFIDESGTPPPPNKKNTKTFVLGGIIIPTGIWHQLNSDFKNILQIHKLSGEMKWRFFSPHNNDPDNPMAGLSWEKRDLIRKQILSGIAKYKSVKIISSYMIIEEAYKQTYIKTENDIYWYCYKTLVERFQYYLQDISRSIGTKQCGLIICDHRENSQDIRLRNLHQNMLNSGGWYMSKYENFIETLFFAPSHMSLGIQLADMIAGCIFRYVEKEDNSNLSIIKNMFRKSDYGCIKGYGLVKIPK